MALEHLDPAKPDSLGTGLVCCLWLLSEITTNLVTSNNTPLFSYISGGHKSKFKVWAGLRSFWRLPGRIRFLIFSSFSRLPVFLGPRHVSHHSTLLIPSSHLLRLSSNLCLSLLMTLVITLGPPRQSKIIGSSQNP